MDIDTEIRRRRYALEVLWTHKDSLNKICEAVLQTLKTGGRLFGAANGGGLSQILHLHGELMGRYKKSRKSLPFFNLCDASTITCLANDYRFEDIFLRQLEGVMGLDDLFICYSGSGNSPNIAKALDYLRNTGYRSVFIGGRGQCVGTYNLTFDLPTDLTQELFLLCTHIICAKVDEHFD